MTDSFFEWFFAFRNKFNENQIYAFLLILHSFLKSESVQTVTAAVLVRYDFMTLHPSPVISEEYTIVLELFLRILTDLKASSSATILEFEAIVSCDRPFTRAFEELPSFIRLVIHSDPLSFITGSLTDDQKAFRTKLTRDRFFKRDAESADATILESELAKLPEERQDLSWIPPPACLQALNELSEHWICTILHHRLPACPDILTTEMVRYLTLRPHWIIGYLRTQHTLLLLPEHYRVLYETIGELRRISNGETTIPTTAETISELPIPNLIYTPVKFTSSLDFGAHSHRRRAEHDARHRKKPEAQPQAIAPIFPKSAFIITDRERYNGDVIVTQIPVSSYSTLISTIFSAPSLFTVLAQLSNLKNEPKHFKPLLAVIGNDCDSARPFLLRVKEIIPEIRSTELTAATSLLVGMSSSPGFTAPFLSVLADLLLLTVLKPRFRLSQQLLKNTSRVLAGLGGTVPGRSLHLINVMLLSGDDCLTEALIPYAKLNPEEKQAVFSSIQVAFDRVVAKAIERDVALDPIKTYLSVLPSLVIARRNDFLIILRKLLQRFDQANMDGIAELFKVLTPEIPQDGIRTDITPDVVAIDPPFWQIVLDFRDRISQLIATNPSLLETSFRFALHYSFLLDFQLKFKLFQDKLKDRQSRRRTRIRVRREEIIADSFDQLRGADSQAYLGEISVSFVDEPGIDFGGVRRDWFTALIRSLFNPEYALFTPERVPNPGSGINPDHIQFFAFTGRLIAKAVFDGITLDCHLPVFLHKELVGAPIGLADFEADPVFPSLQWILENDPADLEMRFVADEESLGVHRVIPLKPGGENILVTNENKEEYVNLLVRHRLIGRVKAQIEAFVSGFHAILSAQDLRMFAPNELDLLICGVPSVDIKDMRKYCGYIFPLNAEHPIVHRFFAVIRHWTKEDLAKLLLFVTGSSQVPVGGFKAFADAGRPFSIAAGGGAARLPVAHTCTNTIDLPDYTSEQEMNEKLKLAITECSTFGFA